MSPTWLCLYVYCKVTSRAVASFAEEERLMPMLNNLSRQYLGPDYGLHKAPTERVTADQVDAVSSVTLNQTTFLIARSLCWLLNVCRFLHNVYTHRLNDHL